MMQPCCRIETAKLKVGVVPLRCPLSDATKPRWKRAPKPVESPATVRAQRPVQQLKAEIAALVQEHFLVSDCGVSYGHIGEFVTKLRQLTAV